jgi:integrase
MRAAGTPLQGMTGARRHLRAVADPVAVADVDSADQVPVPSDVPPSARGRLLELLAGRPVHLTEIDLLALANEPYDGLGHEMPTAARAAGQVALDFFLSAAADDRAAGGSRTEGVAGLLCRYVLPFLLEQRESATGPVPTGELDVRDVKHLRNMLAGERLLPAATVACDRLGRRRLGITCHWLTLAEAEQVTGLSTDQLAESLATGALPVHYDHAGTTLVRAVDLRRAGLLIERETPHGLKAGSARNVLSLMMLVWEHAEFLGVSLSGKPRAVRAKTPLVSTRQRTPRARARVEVPLDRCAQVAGRLHPVHQLVLWLLRLLGLRDGEVFGLLVGDYRDGWLRVLRIGGKTMTVRDIDGRFVKVTMRNGTKTSREGTVRAGVVDVDDEAKEGIEERWLPVPPILRRLLDYVIATAHTDPVTGQVDPNARLVPGLQTDDASLSGFTGALDRAFGAEPDGSKGLRFTPHDLRASLNTDLKNAGIKKRVVRYWLGHKTNDGKQLDVNESHESHYDLGPDAQKLLKAAKVIDRSARHLSDLRIPTALRPQFGRGTRLHARRAQLEQAWTAAGWYRAGGTQDVVMPAGADAPPAEEVLRLKAAAAEIGIKDSQLKRMLTAGDVEGTQVPWGSRMVWEVPRSAVERERARRAQVTLTDLQAELGMTYHPLYHLLGELGVLPADRTKGEAIYLSPLQAQLVRDEVQRRAEVAATVLPTAAVAVRLGLPEPIVQTLLRRGDLVEGQGPVDARLTYVLVSSIETYELQHPAPPPVGPGERVVPVGRVGQILGESRHGVTHLVCSRQLAVISIRRRQYVGVESLSRQLAGRPRGSKPGLIALYSEAQG